MTSQEHRLEAPHRRGKAGPRARTGPRLVERAAVAGYKATSWLLGVLPPGPARAVIGRLSQVVVSRLAGQTAVVEPELRPCPGPATG